jgi:protein-disulfide isomerase
MPAAKASLAAHRQGKFWPMHDKLFANMKQLNQANFEKWAQELELDVEKFKTDMKDAAMEKEILRQQSAMVALGARGTPGFFVNGQQVKGAQPFPKFKEAIDAQLAKVAEQKKAGKSNADAMSEVSKATAGENFVKWVLLGEQAPKAAPPAPPKNRPVADKTVWKVTVDSSDPRKGGAEPLVTLVEFSEFQCPYCSKVVPTMDKVAKEYGDDVAIIFKNNPLPFHKEAGPASEAALAANEQGKFWEMHNLLFTKQRELQRDKLDGYAQQIGLDMAKYKAAMDSGKFKAKIKADQKLAGEVSARGTPNTFVNGRQVTGARPFADFKKLIDEEIVKAKALLGKGIARKDVYNETIKNGKVFKPLEDKVHTLTHEGSPILGDPNAPVKVYEFSDFQCPYCSRVGPAVKDLQKAYGKDVAIVFKHFPLSFHKEALPAAKASMAAMEQGKFWEYHDKLFTVQKQLRGATAEKFVGWAVELGLDKAKFEASFKDPKWDAKVKADMEEGRKAGLRGTPTVYINGRRFQPQRGYSVPSFKSVIDAEFLANK